MSSLFEYYRLNTSDKEDDDCIKFTRVKEEDITICGKSIKEIVTILNGLELERQLDIKMTMENLSYLFKKVMEEQDKKLQENFDRMLKNHI